MSMFNKTGSRAYIDISELKKDEEIRLYKNASQLSSGKKPPVM